jgi:hypothetical protein
MVTGVFTLLLFQFRLGHEVGDVVGAAGDADGGDELPFVYSN